MKDVKCYSLFASCDVHVLLNGPKKNRNMDLTFHWHFMVICHITLTSDEISFQGILLSLCLHKCYLEGPSHWKGTLDVFYARTTCHSALTTTDSKSQSNHQEFHRCCEIALRIFSAKLPQILHQKLPVQMLENY